MITVLWIGIALSLSVAAYLSGAREQALVARAEVNTLRAAELARAGLNVALADLGRVGADQPRTPRDGTMATLRMAEGIVTYRIRDEGGKVDISHAPSELIAPILNRIGEVEGMDAFDAVNVAQALAADAAPGADVRQILRAAGLDSRTADIGARYLTTYGFDAQINPATAPLPVLEAVPGLGPAAAADIVARRESGRPLPRLGSAAAWLVERAGPAYTIEAEARLDTGATARIRALVVARGLGFRSGRMRYEILSVEKEL
ncbi:hypothetical protein [Jannaschia aquimarina]|nr:hypothetical protein [Jannaschia aquimarina]